MRIELRRGGWFAIPDDADIGPNGVAWARVLGATSGPWKSQAAAAAAGRGEFTQAHEINNSCGTVDGSFDWNTINFGHWHGQGGAR